MKYAFAIGAALLAAGAVFARSPQVIPMQQVVPMQVVQQPQVVQQAMPAPQVAVVRAGADSVPQPTAVSVQQAPVQLVGHTAVYEDPTRHMSRPERSARSATP